MVTGSREIEPSQRVRSGSLSADYTIIMAHDLGMWVALGSVQDLRSQQTIPAWILAGTGPTPDDAVEDLRRQLENESHRLVR